MAEEDALDHSRETRHMLNNHIMVTKLEMKNLGDAVGRLESAIKWAGGLVVSLILGVLGWAVLQQINTNETQKREMQQQINLLKEQEAARNESREAIMSRLPPSAPQPAAPASGN